jgi:hypothetical protein
MRKVKVIHSKMDAPMNARNVNQQNNANFALQLYFLMVFMRRMQQNWRRRVLRISHMAMERRARFRQHQQRQQLAMMALHRTNKIKYELTAAHMFYPYDKTEVENAHVREVLFPGYLLLQYKRSHSLFYCAMANSLSLLRDKNRFR